MSFKRIINDLDSYFESMEKKKIVLHRLYDNGNISQQTYDLMDKKINLLISKGSELKEILINEDSLWKTNLLEERRILETLLFRIKYKHLLSEIDEEEWYRKSKILNLALDLTKNNLSLLSSRNIKKPEIATKTVLQNDIKKLEDELTKEDKSNSITETKKMRKIIKEPQELRHSSVTKVHCMNPWNSKCRNRDINLSIYYEGKMTPICKECWEDISRGNIEW